jgi:hypothetical protein
VSVAVPCVVSIGPCLLNLIGEFWRRLPSGSNSVCTDLGITRLGTGPAFFEGMRAWLPCAFSAVDGRGPNVFSESFSFLAYFVGSATRSDSVLRYSLI